MFELPLASLITSYQLIASFNQMLVSDIYAQKGCKGCRLGTKAYQDLVDNTEQFANDCEVIGMLVTVSAARRFSEELKAAVQKPKFWEFDLTAVLKCHNAADHLIGCLRHEATTKAAIMLDPSSIALYEQKEPVFGSEVNAKFISAAYDISEAAKCLSLNRGTATVFHLMRVVETALKAISACLKIPDPNNPNWGVWLKAIKDECENRGKKWPKKDFFQDVYARIDAIKDAQRNTTMHVEKKYTEAEAKEIFDATKAFMMKISSAMDENGQPLA